jgi:O-antigen ligase
MESRFVIWDDALRIFATSPVFGVGYGNYAMFSQVFEFKGGVDLTDPAEAGLLAPNLIKHAHNVYLHILATGGILGLFLLLTILVSSLIGAFRIYSKASQPTMRLLGCFLLAQVAGIIIMNLSGEFLLPPAPAWAGSMMMWWIVIALCVTHMKWLPLRTAQDERRVVRAWDLRSRS